jgi:4-aminobutyrate aminotransferase-like enzyme/Ser/Thr protein kinase RdoA (MazF antagonist)
MDGESQVRELLGAYGLGDATLTRLPGENVNVAVQTPTSRSVLKLAGEAFPPEVLALEQQAVAAVSAAAPDLSLPQVLPTLEGSLEARCRHGDDVLRARLLQFVEGTPWCELPEPGAARARELGRLLARVDLALEHFEHPAATRTHAWDLARAGQHRPSVVLVEDAARRRVLERAFHLWDVCARPRLRDLPQSFIHGDGNDENVLFDGERACGLLDFGDALRNPTVCELAIGLAYALLDRQQPLDLGAEVVAGYHGERPLSADELSVLAPLVVGRWAVTASMAAMRRAVNPDHPNWFVTEDRAWAALERFDGTSPHEFAAALAAHIDVPVEADTGDSPAALLERRGRHVGPSLSLSYDEPLKIVRGRGAHLFDHGGRPYLDLVNNVCHVGHCHPTVVAAGQAQMARLNTNTRYLHDGLTDYAERLAGTLPDPLSVVFVVNSGSEANELALRLARAHTGRRDVVVLDGAYHGHTTSLVDVSPYKFGGPGGSGRAESWVHVAPVPDGYRGVHRGDDLATGRAYGDEVGRVIAEASRPVGAFLCESVLGCGGQVVPPPGYLGRAYEHARESGAVCIADEVQVGFGRVGHHRWAFQLQDVVPDVVVMGKPIGNGHPLSAVVTTPQIAASFANGMEFFSTFGGNPVSCAIGMAVLDVLDQEDLQHHALVLGDHLAGGLAALARRHALIGDVRGVGLFAGVELVRDRQTLEPADREAAELVNRLRLRGLLLSTDGPLHNVIKIKPPLVVSREDVDMFLRCLDDELSALTEEGSLP